MASIIPPTIGEDAPPGEHAVFAALRDAPHTEDWVVFHSLEIAQHVSQVQGEADFVVVAPGHGVLVIVVKPHESIEADGEGRWRYELVKLAKQMRDDAKRHEELGLAKTRLPSTTPSSPTTRPCSTSVTRC